MAPLTAGKSSHQGPPIISDCSKLLKRQKRRGSQGRCLERIIPRGVEPHSCCASVFITASGVFRDNCPPTERSAPSKVRALHSSLLGSSSGRHSLSSRYEKVQNEAATPVDSGYSLLSRLGNSRRNSTSATLGIISTARLANLKLLWQNGFVRCRGVNQQQRRKVTDKGHRPPRSTLASWLASQIICSKIRTTAAAKLPRLELSFIPWYRPFSWKPNGDVRLGNFPLNELGVLASLLLFDGIWPVP